MPVHELEMTGFQNGYYVCFSQTSAAIILNLQNLTDEALAYNFIFISVDYSLLCPASGHDIVQDVKDCFTWITTKLQEHLPVSRRILPSQLVAAGASAGGYLCHLAVSRSQCICP